MGLACPNMTKIAQFIMQKMSKITHSLLYKKFQKSRNFCGRILARILRFWKVYSMSDLWSMKILGRRKLLEEMGPKKLK